MPKLIDYPRTSYPSAWEVAEVVDDTGGKCALDTCARKLNRKVSGSFKAIVGSAVKFGLLTSKREVLTTTTLFRRIKHAYDKQEELLFHREAFLTPPLFTQLCRKFRSRELPVAMLDVLLIREFGVEEINAQSVAKAFADGARMVGILDEHDTMADIDQLAAQQAPRRELANPIPNPNIFRQETTPAVATITTKATEKPADRLTEPMPPQGQSAVEKITTRTTANNPGAAARTSLPLPASRPAPTATADAIAHLFNLGNEADSSRPVERATTASVGSTPKPNVAEQSISNESTVPSLRQTAESSPKASSDSNAINSIEAQELLFRLHLTGPGIETTLEVLDADDLSLVRALLDKIERQLRRSR